MDKLWVEDSAQRKSLVMSPEVGRGMNPLISLVGSSAAIHVHCLVLDGGGITGLRA